MNLKMMLSLALVFTCPSYGNYSYRRAVHSDLDGILQLMKEAQKDDSDKIVLVPERFRRGILDDSISKGRIFVACNPQNVVVGYKKLFIMDDANERSDIINNELRMSSKPVYSCIIEDKSFCESQSEERPFCENGLCIYTGSDYTSKLHRGNGVNSGMTEYALKNVVKKVDHESINLFYGLASSNAGQMPGAKGDRTLGIYSVFCSFLRLFDVSSKEVLHQRYRAYMPQFDPSSEELKPLPDEHSVAGFGCVLVAKRA